MDNALVLLVAFVSLCALILLYVLIDILKLGPWIRGFVRSLGTVVAAPIVLVGAAVGSARKSIGVRRADSGMDPLTRFSGAVPTSVGAASAATFQVRGRIAELEAATKSVGRRNRYLLSLLLLGIALLLGVLWTVYHQTVLSYAVLRDVEIRRDPVDEGRLLISFNVQTPGQVRYRRASGAIETEVVDVFRSPGRYERVWRWIYEPGKAIDASLIYRNGLWRSRSEKSFSTSDRADIVVLIDTTGSMSPSIAQLKEKCVTFSAQLAKQKLQHRFALIGFGDVEEGKWIDEHPFTSDAEEFRREVVSLQRFDGGDLPESALDALEEALDLPFDAGSIRRFYLVTDAQFHEPTSKGTRASAIAARLERSKVLLTVFSKEEFRREYEKLGGSVHFQEIEGFGQALSEGRVLED
jgi:hypothetical protein